MKGSLHHFEERHRSRTAPSTRAVRIMDSVIYVVAVIGPFFTLDQVYRVWIEHTTDGVSIVTWSAFAIISAIWMVYGYVHRNKAIIISNTLWMVLELLVVIGALVYGG